MHVVRLLACVGIILLAATESAANDSWRIVQSAGVVKAGGAGFMPAAVQPNQSLPRDSWVETGASGRVVLARGLESIILGPNSRVQLPSEEVNGNTQVLQSIGSALYQIGKQKAPHFQVDTPYLAAVVKGTTFTITVTEAGSAVEVSEGLVQVATADGSDTEFVQPGFSGIVTKKDSGNVVVVASPRAPAGPGEAAPDSNAKGKSEEARKEGPSEGKGTTVIASVIGELTLDVNAVSQGLVTSVEAPALVAPDKDKKAAEGATSENDRPKESADDGGKVDDASSVKPDNGPKLDSGPVDAGGGVAEPVGGNGNSSVDPTNGNGGGNGGSVGGGNGGGVSGSNGGSVGGGNGGGVSGSNGGSVGGGNGGGVAGGNGPGGNGGGNGNSGGNGGGGGKAHGSAS